MPDVGWVTRGGANPVEFISEHLSRVKALHFKEFTAEWSFSEIGTGVVDFAGVYEFFSKHADDFWIVAEQDRTTRTPQESASANFKAIKKITGWEGMLCSE